MASERRKAPDNPHNRAREQRLVAALRANMKRRKAQARAREQASDTEAAPSHDSAGFMPEIAPDKPRG